MKTNRRTFSRYMLAASTLNVLNNPVITGVSNFFSKKGVDPLPECLFYDDFSKETRTGEGIYRFSGLGKDKTLSHPFYSNDGPGGSPSLNCLMDTSLIPFEDSRSNIVCLLGKTAFNGKYEMEWGKVYGYRQTFKLVSNGAEDGYRCIFFQTHTPEGAPKGSSPLIGLRTNAASEIHFYVDGDEKRLGPTDVRIVSRDIFDKWCTLCVEVRYNYGTEDFQPGYARIYLTIGTEDAAPTDPTASDLIHHYTGNIGFNIPGHGPGYFIGGIYEINYKKSSPTKESAMEMILDNILIQDAPFF